MCSLSVVVSVELSVAVSRKHHRTVRRTASRVIGVFMRSRDADVRRQLTLGEMAKNIILFAAAGAINIIKKRRRQSGGRGGYNHGALKRSQTQTLLSK
jgi:hypothetical protein